MASRQELEALLLRMNEKGASEEEMRFIVNKIKELEPSGKEQKTKQQAIANIEEQARVNTRGVVNAVASGLNQGIFNLLDLPGSVVNLTIDTVNDFTGGGIPRQMNVSEAADRATKYLTGVPIVTEATKTHTDVDTFPERATQKVAEYVAEGVTGGAGLLRQAGNLTADTLKKMAIQETAGGTSAGVTAQGFMEIFGDSPVSEFAGAVTGSLAPSALISSGKKIWDSVSGAYRSLTQEGIKKRVGEQLLELVPDPQETINRIQTNKLLLEDAGIDTGTMTTAQLAQSPEISSAMSVLTKNNDTINNTIARGREENTQVLVENLQKEIPKARDAKDVIATADEYITREQNNLDLRIDLANNQLAKLQNEIGVENFDTATASVRFVNALQTAFDKAKKTESQLWEAVTKKEPLDLQPLKVKIKRLEAIAKKGPTSKSSVPSEEYATANKMGVTRTKDGGTKKLANDFEFLSGYRSEVLSKKRDAKASGDDNKARLLGEIEAEISSFIDKAGTSPQYRAAAQYTRTVYENFASGSFGDLLKVSKDSSPRVSPEIALQRIVKPEGEGAAQAKRVQLLSRGRPTAGIEVPTAPELETLTIDSLRDKFTTTQNKEDFFKRYNSILNTFPTLKRKLQDISTEIDVVSQQRALAEGRRATVTDKSKTAMAALLGADPERLYSKVLEGMSRRDIQAINNIAKADGVEQGLQAVVIEEYINKIQSTTSQGGISAGLDTLDSMLKDKSFRIMFEEVLTSAQQNSLKRFDKVAEVAFGLGEKKVSMKQLEEIEASPAMQTLAQLLALKVSSSVGGGASLAAQQAASRFARSMLSTMTATKSAALLEQAMLNPDIMVAMLRPQAKFKKPEDFVPSFRVYLAMAGIDQEEEEENQ